MTQMVEPQVPARAPLTPSFLVELVAESALEALISAFMLWLMGGIALSIAGGFAGNMVPTAPPFLGASAGDGGGSGEFIHHWWHSLKALALTGFFTVFFLHSLWVGLRGADSTDPAPGVRKRIDHILDHLREHWFGLIVGNAIGAFVSATILGFVQNFSLTKLLWQAVLGLILPVLQSGGQLLLGGGITDYLGNWFAWFGENQTKLTFWCLYAAGAFDDLGVPNLKTLIRWAWRRRQKRQANLAV